MARIVDIYVYIIMQARLDVLIYSREANIIDILKHNVFDTREKNNNNQATVECVLLHAYFIKAIVNGNIFF